MKQSLADQAYAAIKHDIISCEFDPGSQLVQAQLVERYEVGVTPIREALKRLEQEGYIITIPRFGYIVSPITPKYVNDLFELRTILEVSAARLAAQHITPEQVDELRQWADIRYVYKERSSYQTYLEANRRFHVAVALASDNSRLAESVACVLEEMTRIFHIGIDVTDSAEDLRQDHLELVAALAAHNMAQAEAICQEQILRSHRLIIQNVESRNKHLLVYTPGVPCAGLRERTEALILKGLRR